MGDHWYDVNGNPCHTTIAKSTGQPRPTTLADARKFNLLPSVTGIMKILHKQALVEWLIEQTCLAVLTTPKKGGLRCSKCSWSNPHLSVSDTSVCDACMAPVVEMESLDEFVKRVLHIEKVQDQEAQKARDLGTDIHAAMEARLNGDQVDDALIPWIEPAYQAMNAMCSSVIATEAVLVGDGYAGKCDLIAEGHNGVGWIFDFKSTKKLPDKGSYWEHRMQTAAYVCCRADCSRHANVYISTVDQGKFVIHDNGDYTGPWEAFMHLVKYWQIVNQYVPDQSL